MKYLPAHLRQKHAFQEAAKHQFHTHYGWYRGGVTYTDEIAITSNLDYSKYKGAKILIVGGGPTTAEVQWNPSNYDYVFSCNHFFLHPILREHVNFAVLCQEVNVRGEEFLSYYNGSRAEFCFENSETPQDKVQFLVERGRTCIATLRLNLKNGTAARLLLIAASFQPKEVHVVGMDGLPRGSKYGSDVKHSFQKDKTLNSIHFDYDRYYNEYKEIWRYLKEELAPETRFVNLGHGHPYNISTHFNIV